MKDIIRQAVADAAQALFCEFGYFESALKDAGQQGLMSAAMVEREVASEQKRAEQLRQADMPPHAAMVAPQTFIACAAPSLSAIAAKVSDAQVVGPGGFVPRACIQRPALRVACADAALELHNGRNEWFFRAAPASEIIAAAQADKMVSVPVALVDAAKAVVDSGGHIEAVERLRSALKTL